ncbi:hypothetical protein [Ramlibacter sp.]|uniref:hypothetical protein n=1 Tax=Ramlibacter sp. TaxID=1917967 RepID=UPI003D143400
MILQLHIAGPGLDVVRRLGPGDPALVLGRDADCGVCLPDPLRNVSRRHLSVWNLGGELHFHVLSAVNGVVVPSGHLPPGARGILARGEALELAEYRLEARAVEPLSTGAEEATVAASHDGADDPWSVFERDDSGIAPLRHSGAVDARALRSDGTDDDPFGDWGFETTFGPGGPGGGALDASTLGAATGIAPLLRGLGVDAAGVSALTEGELETIGRMMRAMALGLLDMHASAANGPGSPAPARDGGPGSTAHAKRNPLRDPGASDDAKLRYLFGGRAGAGQGMAPEQALAALLRELLAHEAFRRGAASPD